MVDTVFIICIVSVPATSDGLQIHGVDKPYRFRYSGRVSRKRVTVIDVAPHDGWRAVTWEGGKAHVRLDAQNRITDVWVEDPTPEKLRKFPLSRIQASVLEASEMLGGGGINNRRYRLKRPARRKLHETFYANVATAYRDAVVRGMQPRKTIVADTGAADATVAAWIMKARKLGYLPPAEPGKVSAGKGARNDV
jgi:hypothetical protein